jgi:hypothetical protein
MMDTEGTVREKESLTVEKENSIVFKKRSYTHKELRESKEAIGSCITKNNIYTNIKLLNLRSDLDSEEKLNHILKTATRH